MNKFGVKQVNGGGNWAVCGGVANAVKMSQEKRVMELLLR